MSDRIDLIHLGRADPPEWTAGMVHRCRREPTELANILSSLEGGPEALLFWGSPAEPPLRHIAHLLESPLDIWHAGLALGTSGAPRLLDFVRPTWMYRRDPDASIAATSWRLSLDACLVRNAALGSLGGVDTGFASLRGVGLDLGHRAIRGGILVRHAPGLAPTRVEKRSPLGLGDEVRLISNWYGRKWALWAVARAITSGYAPLSAVHQHAWTIQPDDSRISTGLERPYSAPSPGGFAVSVVIPTLDRHDYLSTVLEGLAAQSIAPSEVLIVDQTTPESSERLLDRVPNLPARVIPQVPPGQCSARNSALRQARGDFILFLDDDDDEIPRDLIENHLRTLHTYDAAASCGVADEIGAGPLPDAFSHFRISDVFPTNNTMVRREALVKTGLFDLAYEHGERADADLGMRVYLAGELAVLNPSIRVLHHRAPRGGLRTWGARRRTYAASRAHVLARHLPSVTELYLGLRYHGREIVREKLWIAAMGTLTMNGSWLQRLSKAVLGLLLLPWTGLVLLRRRKRAEAMLQEFPRIPHLP
jgi:glycosyltransferase involved in cell wall biosynthesis